jgi:hypothetical protein
LDAFQSRGDRFCRELALGDQALQGGGELGLGVLCGAFAGVESKANNSGSGAGRVSVGNGAAIGSGRTSTGSSLRTRTAFASAPARPITVTTSGPEESLEVLTPRHKCAARAEFLEISRITAATSAKLVVEGPCR